MEPSSPNATLVFDDLLHVQDVLTVTLIGARDLVPKDRNGLSDPYVITTYQGFSHKTSVKKETLNPQWNETISIPLHPLDIYSDACIYFKVMDKDLVNDDFEGDYTLKFKDIPNLDGIPFECKLENIEQGILCLACQVKFHARTCISDLKLPSSSSNTTTILREQFYKTTRNSWLLGSVKYPMSRLEIETELEKHMCNNNSHSAKTILSSATSAIASSFTSPKSPMSPRSPRRTRDPIKWQQVRISETLMEILTEAECFYGCMMNTPSSGLIVDRVRVELVLAQDFSQSHSQILEHHLQQQVLKTNTCTTGINTWKSVSFNESSEKTLNSERNRRMECLKQFSGEFQVKDKAQNLRTTKVNGKAYSIPIGNCSLLSFVYLSNCGMPFESSFDEMVLQKAVPPTRNTLFTPLHCDIHDSLWLKWPCGWDFEEESCQLVSPIQKSGKGVDRFMATHLISTSFSSSSVSTSMTKNSNILQQLALEYLQSLKSSSPVRNVNIRKNLHSVERPISGGTTQQSEKGSTVRDFVEFEIEYNMDESSLKLYRIGSVTNTFGENYWLLSYESSSETFPNRDVFECVLGQIKYDELKIQE
ncbi:hypothetical protein C9374_007984 [Naegleria lovaniensis]|uniref:C2 domain-containing protein n=1 Tax=Naegleria lovaniensis TaxID=51637 RepID=A0AA88KI35_NAELO|nr:uncharacterized protein C9374_007984 [Naegleria lovaniensis]KAG2378836.1 hypothetical protein C9374_007984 [Naegleria lovaniensis]